MNYWYLAIGLILTPFLIAYVAAPFVRAWVRAAKLSKQAIMALKAHVLHRTPLEDLDICSFCDAVGPALGHSNSTPVALRMRALFHVREFQRAVRAACKAFAHVRRSTHSWELQQFKKDKAFAHVRRLSCSWGLQQFKKNL